jgi:isoleucyl-tRNA synthetase
LNTDKVIVERIEKADLRVVNDGTLTVGLDTKVTDDLKREGFVRDLVRGIQNLRKESGFAVTDRIEITLSGDSELKASFEQFKVFIGSETLAVKSEWKDSIPNGESIEADDKIWSASIVKA